MHNYESCSYTLATQQDRMVKKWAKYEAVIGPILNVLRAFDRAIATCTNAKPEVAALIWGSVQALLMVRPCRILGNAKPRLLMLF
jgi:hypothetical protein